MKKNIIHEDGVLLVDSKFFGDDREHKYDCDCMNGHAYCILSNMSDSAPYSIEVFYPKIEELTEEQKKHILDYRGLYDLTHNDIHYGDVMVVYGNIKY